MIKFNEVLDDYLKRTGFLLEDIILKSKDRRISESRQLLWLVFKEIDPLVRYKDIVDFMDTIGHKTTVSNVQQGVKMIEDKISYKKYKYYKDILYSCLDPHV
jgi:hypothetical protein